MVDKLRIRLKDEYLKDKNKFIKKSIDYMAHDKSKIISWLFFKDYTTPILVTYQAYTKSGLSPDHTYVNKCLAYWETCGYIEKKEKKKIVNRFKFDIRLCPIFFRDYLYYEFGIKLTKKEILFMETMINEHDVRKFLFNLYSYKNEKSNARGHLDFNFTINETLLKLFVGFIHGRVNFTYKIIDAESEILFFKPKLIKSWEKIRNKITNELKIYDKKSPGYTIYKKIIIKIDKNKIY